MIVEKQMECRLCMGNREVLGENLPQPHFCPSQNPTWPDPGLNMGRRGEKPATNRLSYGAAQSHLYKTGCSELVKKIFLYVNSYDNIFWNTLLQKINANFHYS
jgi:hypothetical protein